MIQPTELEKQQYEALAEVVDEIRVPLEITRGGLAVCRFSPEQVEQIETAFKLFSVVHGLVLRQGKYREVKAK